LRGMTTPTAGVDLGIAHSLPGSAPDQLTRLSIQASYDSGASWHPLAVTRTATGGHTQLDAPAGPTTQVSLRMSAADAQGNTVDQVAISFLTIR
ncbi:MAG: hypothetical protein ABI890_06510, partial [Lapillicoccus sp.]